MYLITPHPDYLLPSRLFYFAPLRETISYKLWFIDLKIAVISKIRKFVIKTLCLVQIIFYNTPNGQVLLQ